MKSRVHPTYKTKYHVQNWAAYDRALVCRGDITIWLSPAAIAAWEPDGAGTRGAQRKYSDLAIESALTLRLLFHLPRRLLDPGIGSATLSPFSFPARKSRQDAYSGSILTGRCRELSRHSQRRTQEAAGAVQHLRPRHHGHGCWTRRIATGGCPVGRDARAWLP